MWEMNLEPVDAMLIGRQGLYSAGLKNFGSRGPIPLSDLSSREWTDGDDKAVAPTQRISEVCEPSLLVLAIC